MENKPILLSDVTDVIGHVYLNFHEIDTNSQKFIPKIYFFKIKGFNENFQL